MFERFTDRARRVLVLAQEEARLLNHGFIGTEHILLGLIHEGEGVAARALESLGISLTDAREKVEETLGPGSGTLEGSAPFTPHAKKVLELALREALQLGHSYIGTEHILLGLVREGNGVGVQVLVSLGTDISSIRTKVTTLMSGARGGAPSGTDPSRRVDPHWLPSAAPPRAPRDQRCILCDRDLWDVRHFVSRGRFQRVCEECVRTAADLLDKATAGQRALVMPPRVSGEPPDDNAVSAIVDALRIAFSSSADPESRVAAVEDFAELEPLYRRHIDHLAEGPDGTSVDRVRFLGEHAAEVRFEILRSGGAMASFEGRVHRRDGHWMVARSTVASVLGPGGTRSEFDPSD